jgi:hypothetical protein
MKLFDIATKKPDGKILTTIVEAKNQKDALREISKKYPNEEVVSIDIYAY